jgi:hypothetical protein
LAFGEGFRDKDRCPTNLGSSDKSQLPKTSRNCVDNFVGYETTCCTLEASWKLRARFGDWGDCIAVVEKEQVSRLLALSGNFVGVRFDR